MSDYAERGFAVLAYGADLSGVDPSTYALQAAVNRYRERGLTELPLPPGRYLIDEQINAPGVTIVGASNGDTVIVGGIPYGASFSWQGGPGALVSGGLRRLTLDLENSPNASGVGMYYFDELIFEDVVFQNTAFKFIQNYVDTQSTVDNQSLVVKGCSFGASTAPGAELVTLANTASVRIEDSDFASGRASSANDVLLYQLIPKSRFVRNTHSNRVAYSFSCNDITFDDCEFDGGGIAGANSSDHGQFGYTTVNGLRTRKCRFNGGTLSLGSTIGYSDVGSTWEESNFPIEAVASAGGDAYQGISLLGSIFRNNNPTVNNGLVYLNTGGSIGLVAVGVIAVNTKSANTQGALLNLAASAEYDDITVHGCQGLGGTNPNVAMGPGTLGPNVSFSKCPGLGTAGGQVAQPSVPAVGTALVNPYRQPICVYLPAAETVEIDGTNLGSQSFFYLPTAGSVTFPDIAPSSWIWMGA